MNDATAELDWMCAVSGLRAHLMCWCWEGLSHSAFYMPVLYCAMNYPWLYACTPAALSKKTPTTASLRIALPAFHQTAAN